VISPEIAGIERLRAIATHQERLARDDENAQSEGPGVPRQTSHLGTTSDNSTGQAIYRYQPLESSIRGSQEPRYRTWNLQNLPYYLHNRLVIYFHFFLPRPAALPLPNAGVNPRHGLIINSENIYIGAPVPGSEEEEDDDDPPPPVQTPQQRVAEVESGLIALNFNTASIPCGKEGPFLCLICNRRLELDFTQSQDGPGRVQVNENVAITACCQVGLVCYRCIITVSFFS
jgi:hypothetical protein